jgi:hypothetical protein
VDLEELERMARKDGIYLFWKRCAEDLEEPFKAYIRQQPPEVYRLLSSYVGACGMMLQRKILLAAGWKPDPDFPGDNNA